MNTHWQAPQPHTHTRGHNVAIRVNEAGGQPVGATKQTHTAQSHSAAGATEGLSPPDTGPPEESPGAMINGDNATVK